jgi:hypothetical protein
MPKRRDIHSLSSSIQLSRGQYSLCNAVRLYEVQDYRKTLNLTGFDMSKRIRLSISPEEKQETDWLKWFLCQVDKDEVLKYPQNPS